MNFGGGEWAVLGIGVAVIVIYIIAEIISDVPGCLAFFVFAVGVSIIIGSVEMGVDRAPTVAAVQNLEQQGFHVFGVDLTNQTAVIEGSGNACITQVRIVQTDGVWVVQLNKHIATPSEIVCGK